MITSVGVIGGGAWGTALALVAARAGRDVVLYARDPETVAAVTAERENIAYLPGVAIEPGVTATGDIARAATASLVILAVPAQAVRDAAWSIAPHLTAGTPLIVAAKGLERGTDRRMSEVIAEAIPEAIPAVLSGPSFAADVGRGLPTAVTVAAADGTLALELCRALAGPTFRPYAETDMLGVEIGGAVKNVLAIAAGIVAGHQLGASALAALVARGFAELRRLGDALGARPETLMGLSGLGDLVLTCSGPQSRNFSYGRNLGAGGSPEPPDGVLVEGIATAAVAGDLARRNGVAMPIVDAVAAIVEGALSVEDAVAALMTRPLKHEAD